MDILFERCAGLDVHKRTVVACRVRKGEQETRTFGTMTRDLLQLLDWLQAWQCTHVAMESTGEYWKPIYNILEGNLEVWLVNARHVKAVPGRKTDVKDAEWLAELLQHGLLRASFIPPRDQRDLRDLTRQRSNLVGERTMVVNQLQRVLETANVKLASVATDVTGVSARAMLEQIVAGQADPAVMAALARGRMRSKQEELKQALTGRVRDHHRFLIGEHLTHIDFLDEHIAAFDAQIDAHLNPPDAPAPASTPPCSDVSAVTRVPYPKAVELLDSIPGVNKRLAEVLIAEIGTDMSRFPSAHHLASWAGVCPGNNCSANQQRSGRIAPGNRPVRTSLVQAAQAAAHTKDTYLSAQYHRLVVRRGQQKAITAIAHSILVSAYYILVRQEPYRDLGGNYFDQHQKEAVTNHLVRRLEKLGFEVTLTPTPVTC